MAFTDSTPSQEFLCETFDYDEGKLYWKKNFTYKIKKGNLAGTKNSRGYFQVGMNGKLYLIHRIIFKMHNGYLPQYLDHIDTNRENNRIENLRPATSSENHHNASKRTDNKSGVKGVCWDKRRSKWRASCHLNGVQYCAGLYDSIEEAKKQLEVFRKSKHGSFANNG